jgi:predicted PurR-regulated permease PerM
MPRIAVVLSTIGAFLLAVAVVAVLTSQVMAFETENAAATVPGGTTQFQDPDENLLMAPTNNETLPLLKDDTSDNAQTSGSTLQLAPGTTLQIMGGSGPSSLGLQSGVPMGPIIDRSNPADNQSLIPSPL